MRNAWVFLVLVVTACGGPRSIGRCPVRPRSVARQSVEVALPSSSTGSSGGAASVVQGSAMAPPAPVQPTSQAARDIDIERADNSPGEASAPEDCDGLADAPPAPDAAAAHEATIAREQAGLAAGTAECRDVCRAAGTICVAAGEVCRITGDTHARCERARLACTDASRLRDGRCAQCPAP